MVRSWNKDCREEIENMILCMADIIEENRCLREEVTRLNSKVEEFHKKEQASYEKSHQTFQATIAEIKQYKMII